MELPRHVVEGVSAVSGAGVSDAAYRLLVATALGCIVDSDGDGDGDGSNASSKQQQAEAKLVESPELKGVAAADIKRGFASLLAFFIEVFKHNAASHEIMPFLEDAKMSADRVSLTVQALEASRSRGLDTLSRIGTSFPSVVGVKWRLDYYVKSDVLEQVKAPLYFITLQTQKPDGTLADIEFTCNYQELQDLLSKLQDSVKQVERVLAATQKST